jgi:hypothetical protein
VFFLNNPEAKHLSHKMENTELYIQYLTNQPVPIDKKFGRGPQGDLPLVTVSHVIAAFQTRPGSLLANTDAGLISLELPVGVPRTALSSDCFASSESTGTTLRNGLELNRLNRLDLDDQHPLIIRSGQSVEALLQESISSC